MFYSESRDMWFEWVTLADGSQKRIGAKTSKKLSQKLLEFKDNASHGRTFEECADGWERAHESKIEATTAQAYKAHINRAKDFFEGRYIKDITPDEVQAYVDHLVELDFAKDTVRRGLVVVNKIFKWAITQPGSIIRFNPCASVEIPRGLKQTQREPPTQEQLDLVALADPKEPIGLFARFAWYSGLRPGELLALRWEDIDRANKTITVNKAVQYVSNQASIKDKTKTPAGMRQVPLLDILADALPDKSKGYVFGGDKPWSKTVLRKKWLMWCREHDLAEAEVTEFTGKNGHRYKRTRWKPLITAYQFRHEYASVLEDEQISEFSAQHVMGHASIVTTKDKYTQFRARKGIANSDVAVKLNARYSVQNCAPSEDNG